jgi:tRNA-dependent cyclodipeptide synthase
METNPIDVHLSPWHHVEWDQLELDDLVFIQRKARTAIETRRKQKGKLRQIESGERVLPEPLYLGKEGYRTLVTQVAPTHLRDTADKLDRCLLGVSLGGANAATFQGAKLEAIVRWIAARANRCRVLVGDSLGRISLEVREGMEPHVAAPEARALGRRYVAETEAIFRRYTTDQVSFEFCYGTDYADHPGFRPYLANVRAIYQEDAAFRRTVHAFGDEYLARTWRGLGQGEASPSERLQQIAREYLLEEIALLSCLAADGWPVMVYPGSIDSIVEIAEGRYPSLPAPLQALGFISLWLDAKSGSR